MRFKYRYLLCRISIAADASAAPLQTGFLYKLIKDSVHANFGEYGLGLCLQGLQVKYYNSSTNLLIVRAPRADYRLVAASLTFLTNIKGREIQFNFLHVGGSIRSCQKAAIRFNREVLTEIWKDQKLLNLNTGQALNEQTQEVMNKMKEESEKEIMATET
jgi:ribonuclease P/MRP protein subunit POP5